MLFYTRNMPDFEEFKQMSPSTFEEVTSAFNELTDLFEFLEILHIFRLK